MPKKGYKATKEHREALSKSHKGLNAGDKNYFWKGGRKYGGSGTKYVLIYSPNHPYKGLTGYVYEHRLVMEKHLGRYLLPTEIVHHINGIPDDNRIENLELFENKRTHAKSHSDKVNGMIGKHYNGNLNR